MNEREKIEFYKRHSRQLDAQRKKFDRERKKYSNSTAIKNSSMCVLSFLFNGINIVKQLW